MFRGGFYDLRLFFGCFQGTSAPLRQDLEIVDVEPTVDVQASRCFAFAEAAQQTSSAAGAWLLGFLVYDRQPGQMTLG